MMLNAPDHLYAHWDENNVRVMLTNPVDDVLRSYAVYLQQPPCLLLLSRMVPCSPLPEGLLLQLLIQLSKLQSLFTLQERPLCNLLPCSYLFQFHAHGTCCPNSPTPWSVRSCSPALHRDWAATRSRQDGHRLPQVWRYPLEGRDTLEGLFAEPVIRDMLCEWSCPAPRGTRSTRASSDLLSSQNPLAKNFREDMWKYNRTFAFTSLGVTEDHSINQRRGPPVFRISGELHHSSGALTPAEGRRPRYAQLYIYEPRAALEARASQNRDLNINLIAHLQVMLSENHQYVPVYKHAYEILQAHGDVPDAQVRLRLEPGVDRRRYNLPTADEVAVILPGDGSCGPRDIILRQRGGPLHRISDLHPAYTPLQYPLLFPRGENGWHPQLQLQVLENEGQGGNPHAGEDEEDGEAQLGDEENPRSRRMTLLRHTRIACTIARVNSMLCFEEGDSLHVTLLICMLPLISKGYVGLSSTRHNFGPPDTITLRTRIWQIQTASTFMRSVNVFFFPLPTLVDHGIWVNGSRMRWPLRGIIARLISSSP
ncbi:hypothetical protein CPB84DRAFT_908724 [Gymnopilus junonius]|uniref:Helitron helicase-like domain-containing protein n=1 Tax=Gymnopilus junonius TaxID=109634 RepID=A0A9P5NQ75_GYMJU|nr:hypothetical protein CPB84DRAFT_908724 [Gymnopilus junonius]